jgi:hypothetical protein
MAASASPSRHPFLKASDEPCEGCRAQMRKARTALPHSRLMVVSSGPMAEVFGGGVETRYVCLDCGHTVIHSTGRWGSGWH